MESIVLPDQWLDEALSLVKLKDRVEEVKMKRAQVQNKLRRMAKAYVDGLFPDSEYHRQKRLLEMELEGLVVPQASAAEEAGKLVRDLPRLWKGANEEERRKLVLTVLDAVYVDPKGTKSIVAVKPKPPFRPVFQVAITHQVSGVILTDDRLAMPSSIPGALPVTVTSS